MVNLVCTRYCHIALDSAVARLSHRPHGQFAKECITLIYCCAASHLLEYITWRYNVAAGPVQEEVFENERFQPFKGWGHNWPGHFLPTDKIGHWSHRDGTPGKAASMAFSTVAPKLPKVCVWIA